MDTRSTRAAIIRVGSYEFKKKGISRFGLGDPYHLAVALSWPRFLAVLLTVYITLNLVFAALFWLVPGSVANARIGSFGDAFFFSIETVTTVGYGDFHPATFYGHGVAAIEKVCGLAFTAMLTGLTFVRFSRPRAKLIFAANPVVATHNGKPTLMIRIGNGRPSTLMDAVAKLNVLMSEKTSHAGVFRRAQELRLERAHLPIFPLFWTLMHVLDEQSPLFGYDEARVIETQTQVFVTIEARDPTLETIVHDIREYGSGDIRFGMRYSNMVSTADDGATVVDLTKTGELQLDFFDRPEPGWADRELEHE